MLQFVRPTQCFWYFTFFVLFCLWRYKGQGQWVIKYYINIYERKRRWFLIQKVNWACGGLCEDDPSHLDRNLNFSNILCEDTHTQTHTHTNMHSVFLPNITASPLAHPLSPKHASSLNDAEGKPYIKDAPFTCLLLCRELPVTGHHDADVWSYQPQQNSWTCL